MTLTKNPAEMLTLHLLGLFGDYSTISSATWPIIIAQLYSYKEPYTTKELNPTKNEKVKEIESTYHPDFFISGDGTRREQANREVESLLSREGTGESYEDRAKKGTLPPQ